MFDARKNLNRYLHRKLLLPVIFVVLLIGRPGRMFMQKIVILLLSGLIIFFADFFSIFPFFTGISNLFYQLKLYNNRLVLFSLFKQLLNLFAYLWGSFLFFNVFFQLILNWGILDQFRANLTLLTPKIDRKGLK